MPPKLGIFMRSPSDLKKLKSLFAEGSGMKASAGFGFLNSGALGLAGLRVSSAFGRTNIIPKLRIIISATAKPEPKIKPSVNFFNISFLLDITFELRDCEAVPLE